MTVNLFIVATEKHCNPQSRVVTKTTKWYMPVLRHTRFRVCAPVVQTLDRWRYPPKIITIQGISVSQYPADSSAWHLLGSAVQSTFLTVLRQWAPASLHFLSRLILL